MSPTTACQSGLCVHFYASVFLVLTPKCACLRLVHVYSAIPCSPYMLEEPAHRPVSFYHGAPNKGVEVIQYLEATSKQPVQGATSWGFRIQAALGVYLVCFST